MSPLSKSLLPKSLTTLVVLLAFCHIGLSRKRDYLGYSVIRSLPQTQWQLDHLASLMKETSRNGDRNLEFWTEPRALNESVDILVSPERRHQLEGDLSRWTIPTEDFIKDVAQSIKVTRMGNTNFDLGVNRVHTADNSTVNLKQMLTADRFYNEFQRYSTIEAKIQDLAQLDPRVRVGIIGKSYEKRPIYLVKVSNDFNANKPIVLIDGGHHAREWISHSTVVYLLESLVNIDIPRIPVSKCTNDRCRRESVRNLARLNLNKYDYWFIPVVNPDGYEHSHISDRLWRKTRSASSFCSGVDPNRNYPFHWNESGSSRYSCSEIYSGPRAASEPEVRAVMSVMDKNKDRIVMYLSFHCYSQLVLAPYGYARVYPNNYADLQRVASFFLDSMKRLRNTEYEFGTSAITLYPSSGGSDDYAHSIGIPLAYTVELPDKGSKGFLTPPADIIPIAHETLIGVQSMIDGIAN